MNISCYTVIMVCHTHILLTQSHLNISLIPRLIGGKEREPGVHCLHMYLPL